MNSTAMDQAQALKLLGLSEDASTEQIAQAYQAKQQQVQGLLEKAPTDGLKEKYQKMLVQLGEAKQVLSVAQSGSSSQADEAGSPRSARDDGRAGLSQTKLADLPGANPFETQLEGGVAGVVIQLQVGQILAGRYEIKEQIGAGGMGAVYQAFDQTRQQDVAIKVMLPSLVNNERAKSRFMDEARLSSQLSHPSIVNVFDVQQDGDYVFLTMELLHGQDLRSLMETRKLSRQAFSEQEAKDIALSLCEALAYAHKHTVHRDIKPENIWLTEDGEVKLMDFGIARVMSNSQRTQSGMVSGTAYYMAPEQLKGTGKVDGRADLYALGIMLYEMLSGDVPAGRFKSIREHRKELSKGFAAAIDQSLEPSPDDRQADAMALAEALNKKGSGFSLPSFDAGGENMVMAAAGIVGDKYFMATVALVGILLLGGVMQSGVVDFGSMFMSKVEITQHKEASDKLARKIKQSQNRLENSRRSLDSDIRDAKRNNTSNLKALEYWQQLTEDIIFEGSILTELEGRLAMADTLLKDHSFTQAINEYTEVSDKYDYLTFILKIGKGMFFQLQDNPAYNTSDLFADEFTLWLEATAYINKEGSTARVLCGRNYHGPCSIRGSRIQSQGLGTLTWANGNKYVGGFIDGRRTGKGTFTWPNGDKYVGGFIDGRRTGKGTYTWASGDKYVGDFVSDLRTGKGTFTWASGNKYVGGFIDGKKNGKGTFTWANGKKNVGNFVGGKMVD